MTSLEEVATEEVPNQAVVANVALPPARKEGRIVGQAPSRVVVNHDPTAHAETEAIRDAARRLGPDLLERIHIESGGVPARVHLVASMLLRAIRSLVAATGR